MDNEKTTDAYQNACIQRSICSVERGMLNLLREMYPHKQITTRQEMKEVSKLNTHTCFFEEAMDQFTSLYNECYNECGVPGGKVGEDV